MSPLKKIKVMKQSLKKVYELIPLKKQFYTALKKVWRPEENIFRHLHFKGVINVPIDNSRSFKINHFGYQIENELFWKGLVNGWEKESIQLWLKLCLDSDIILDIGANTGVYSLIAKTIKPTSKVYAFEPVNRVFSKLKQNITLNNYDINPFEKAVSNEDGTAIIYDTLTEHTYSVTVNKNLSSPETKVSETKISTITLDTFVRQENLKKIDLIKIDVETHEAEVLEGFANHISKFKPTILIEILNDEVGSKVNKLVKDLGYLYFNIDEKSGIRQVNTITKSDYYNYLLCNPETAAKLGLIKKLN